jgi:hypothetical protein
MSHDGRKHRGIGNVGSVAWREMPRSPGHVFCDGLEQVLIAAGFDAFAEATCKPFYKAKMGAASILPCRSFRATAHGVGIVRRFSLAGAVRNGRNL